MVRTRRGTNTYGKENKTTKKAKKPDVEAKTVIDIHNVKLKGVVLWGNGDGPDRGPLTMEVSKEARKKKLNKVGDHTSKVPLTMYDLIGKWKYDGSKVSKVDRIPSNHTNHADQLAKEVLNVAPLQIIVSVTVKSKVSKNNPSKNVFEDMLENVAEVSKTNTKTQNVNSENLTQTVDSLHACDKPPNEDIIENIFSENPV